jgi:Rieske Fe-S protein
VTDDASAATRRALLAGAGAAGAAVTLAGCGEPARPAGAPASAVPPASAAPPASTVPPGSTVPPASAASPPMIRVADIPVHGGKIFPDLGADGVVVTQPSAGRFMAFSATCTHRGCTLASVSDGTINCPCHGGRFSIVDGSVVQAGDGVPTGTGPLPPKKVTITGAMLTVD